jgi:hypothetical protein
MSRRKGGLPGEVFLSHSSKDRNFASRIARVIRAHGVPVWYSETNILGAQQWHDEIGAALKRCDWFLILLSPAAVRSNWVKHELLYALSSARYEKRITPVWYRSCDSDRLSWTIASYQAVDFRRDFHDGCISLMRSWGLGYDRTKDRQAGKPGPRSKKQ